MKFCGVLVVNETRERLIKSGNRKKRLNFNKDRRTTRCMVDDSLDKQFGVKTERRKFNRDLF